MHSKKRLLALSLAILLLAGCGGAPEPPAAPPPDPAAGIQEEPADTGPSSFYDAYAGIVQEYRLRYGPERIQAIPSPAEELDYLMGLCIIRLIDFDLDGTPELLLCWPESEEAYHSYRYAVWTSTDGKTAEPVCENRVYDGAMSYLPHIRLVQRADGAYVGEELEAPEADLVRVYRKPGPGGLSDALTLCYTPPYGDEEQYLVNGESVSAKDYAQAEANFLDGAQVEEIPFVFSGPQDAQAMARMFQATYIALDQLGIQSLEASTGSSTGLPGGSTGGAPAAASEPADAGPYRELIEQYLLEYGQPQALSSSRWDGGNETPALGGLCVVRAADMDGDGTDELLLIYAREDGGPYISYGYGVWTLRDGKAEELLRHSTPGSAREPTATLYAGEGEACLGVSYDTNSQEAASIADVEYEARCYGYDGERTYTWDSFAEIPDRVKTGGEEWICFSAYSYRWAAGMDWETDSRRVLDKTREVIGSFQGP